MAVQMINLEAVAQHCHCIQVALRNAIETGDLISENEKDGDGSVEINSPTSEDHPHSFNEGNEDLKSGELPSVHIYEGASRAKCGCSNC
ncbi:hypothetical protein BT93_E1871 [Corymbia citriodora subsp. variegata]|nr:hypothetical protein BT93_E1871 [Corymbia citriodora subsp. variegata]